jgi:curli biogenesis system outer membrane secretion channel CsgG
LKRHNQPRPFSILENSFGQEGLRMLRVLVSALLVGFLSAVPSGAQTTTVAAAAVAKTPSISSTTPATQVHAGRKKRVVVFDFDYATVMAKTQALFRTNVDVGKGISDLLVRNLVEDGTYSVIERKDMDRILNEQNFSNSDRANKDSAAKIGKLLGADAIIVGSVTQFGSETKETSVGGNGWGSVFGQIAGVGKKKTKAEVVVDARLVDINTAEIVGVATGKGESSRESTVLVSSTASARGGGGGAADFSNSDFQQTLMGEAVNAAVTQLATELIADNSKLTTHAITVEGLVAMVDSGQIVLNIGSKAGLKVGDQLTVKRITREVKDPATGQIIRKMTADVGVIRITDVDEISAVGAPVSGAGFKVGDEVKTVTQ